MANRFTGSLIGTPELYVEKFRLLASQIGDNFRYTEAVGAQVWSTHIGLKLGLSYNEMRELAGLPLLRIGRHKGAKKEYIPKVQPQKRSTGPLVNPCLGYGLRGTGCNKKLPKGQHFCPQCKKRKDGYYYD